MRLDYTPPSAWMGLEHFLNWLIITKQPEIFVEVGVYNGFSYFCACQTVKAHELKTSCYGVDTWQGDIHTEYPNGDEIFTTVTMHNDNFYKDFSRLIRKPSVEAARDFENRSLDIIHIDAGHRYEDIKGDFFAWLPKMKKGSVVLIHDVVCTGPEIGVNRFWNEVMQFFPSFHIDYSYGLGVLTIDRYPE